MVHVREELKVAGGSPNDGISFARRRVVRRRRMQEMTTGSSSTAVQRRSGEGDGSHVKHDRELRAGGLFGRKVNPEPGLEFGVEIHVLAEDRLVVRNLDVVCGGDGRNFEETSEGTVGVEDDVDVLVGFCTVGGEQRRGGVQRQQGVERRATGQ
ncbi:hypothetical protein U1Q18_022396, partial [Sarracenia purpurea var. burkii]